MAISRVDAPFASASHPSPRPPLRVVCVSSLLAVIARVVPEPSAARCQKGDGIQPDLRKEEEEEYALLEE